MTVSIEWLKSGRSFVFVNDKNETVWSCIAKQSVVGGINDGKYLIKYENKRRKIVCEQYVSRSTRVFLK